MQLTVGKAGITERFEALSQRKSSVSIDARLPVP
jgi:hypothetical protein